MARRSARGGGMVTGKIDTCINHLFEFSLIVQKNQMIQIYPVWGQCMSHWPWEKVEDIKESKYL